MSLKFYLLVEDDDKEYHERDLKNEISNKMSKPII